MFPISRLTDQTIGVCQVHGPQGGHIIEGHSNSIVGMLPDSTITHTVMANCSHTGVLVTGNPTLLDNNLPTVRITSQFVGIYSGQVITGEQTAFTL